MEDTDTDKDYAPGDIKDIKQTVIRKIRNSEEVLNQANKIRKAATT